MFPSSFDLVGVRKEMSKCSKANGVREYFPSLQQYGLFSAGDCLPNTLPRGEVVQHFIITQTHSLHTKGVEGVLISACSDGLKSNSFS